MNQNPSGTKQPEQHGRKPGQAPSDIDQDRGSVEPGSRKPGGDGQKTAPERDEREDRPRKGDNPNSPQPGSTSPTPRNPGNPASKPQGTTKDQIANMENEGQAQEPAEPDGDGTTQPRDGTAKGDTGGVS